MKRLLLFVLIFLSLFLSGCATKEGADRSLFGLKTVPECEEMRITEDNATLMDCYYKAAITEAYLYQDNVDMASGICDQIWSEFGYGVTNDQAKRAERVAYACYSEVAKIAILDPNSAKACTYIGVYSAQTGGTGGISTDFTQKNCIADVARLKMITPEQMNNNANNVCALVAILPLFVLMVLRNRN